MIGVLALIGLFVILWWFSKVMKKMSTGLEMIGNVLADFASYCNKKPVIDNRVSRQNISAEEKLHNIKGEVCYDPYTQKVLAEIDEQEKAINGL